jgi:mannitol operon repressor
MPSQRKSRERGEKAHDLEGFGEEFRAESDRATAILGAALLDEWLRQLLAGFLVDDSTRVDKLLGIDRPLGSFSSRSLAAYCLGLVGKDECHDLEIIGRIRNDFAHDLHGLSFSSESVRDRCDELLLPKRLHLLPRFRTARGLFIASVTLLVAELKDRAHEEGRRVVHSDLSTLLRG